MYHWTYASLNVRNNSFKINDFRKVTANPTVHNEKQIVYHTFRTIRNPKLIFE